MDRLRALEGLGRLSQASGESSLRWKQYENEVPSRSISNVRGANMAPNDMHYVIETAESVI